MTARSLMRMTPTICTNRRRLRRKLPLDGKPDRTDVSAGQVKAHLELVALAVGAHTDLLDSAFDTRLLGQHGWVLSLTLEGPAVCDRRASNVCNPAYSRSQSLATHI